METSKQRMVKHEIPEGAIILTRAQAVSGQSSLLLNWKPQSEVWPLVHGTGILATTAGLIGAYINMRFRRKLKIQNVGQLASTAALVGGPALSTALCHSQIIMDKLLLLEVPCPLCLELKSSLIQTFFGLFIPVLTTPLINFMVVGSKSSNIPHIHDGRKMFTLVRSAYQTMIPTLGLILIFQALIGGYMTHLQIKSYLHVLDTQYLIEKNEGEKVRKVYIT